MSTERLQSLTDLIDTTDATIRAGSVAGARVWPTGFHALDKALSGGLRSGELVLLGGPQGLGKTTLALQLMRNVVAAGRTAVYFSFEHDTHTLLERLISLEAAEHAGLNGVPLHQVRERFEVRHGQSESLADRLAGSPGGPEAVAALRDLGGRLHVHRSSGVHTDLAQMRSVVEAIRDATGEAPLVLVDYLQKVAVGTDHASEDEQVAHVAEGLKELALELAVPVAAIVAAEKSALKPGMRMRARHLRGSSALAYEADILLLMAEKFDVVARHHLVYDLGNADRFRRWVVVTIEKNRNGVDKVELEFHKRFEQSRFDPEGREVTEQLVEERVFVD